MRSSFWGIQVGYKALSSQQKALDVTGHNIANANTQGFTRQRAIMTPTSPYTMPGLHSPISAGQMGTGVRVEEVKRIRDHFIDLQIRDELRSLGSWEQKSKYLEKIEVFFNEPSDAGLRTVFTRFFDAIHDLAKKPGDDTARSLVIQRGHAVAENFNQMTRQFRDTTLAVDATLKAKVSEVNSYSRQIRDLNEQIVRIENSGDNANDLRDKRDLLLDDLSKLISVDYMEMEDGSMLVSTGGRSLVQGVYCKELELKTYDATEHGGVLAGQPKLVWKDSGEEYRFVKLSGVAESGKAVGSSPASPFTVGDFSSGIRLTGGIQLDDVALGGSPLIIDSSSNQLVLTANGVTKTIVLTEKTYDGVTDGQKAEDLLAELNLKLKETFGDGSVNAFLDSSGYLVFSNESSALEADLDLDDTSNGFSALFGTQSKTIGSSFSFILDGETKTINLTQGSYNDLADLVTELNNQFDAVLGTGKLVVVDAAGKLEFESLSKGNNSSIWGFSGAAAKFMGLDKVKATPGKDVEVQLSGGGEIAGLWEVRSLIIPDYVEKMNQLMVRFADALNVQHQQGYDLNGNQGKALFNVSPEVQNDVIKARYLSMVITNPNELAASDTPGGIPGNGDNAWNITNLRNGPALSEGNASFDEFIRSVVGGLGIQSQEAARMRDNQALLVVQIENQRQSVSGVSLDEEMTNLIKYQHAYGAAARMVTTVDEMLELIVSRLGIVGR